MKIEVEGFNPNYDKIVGTYIFSGNHNSFLADFWVEITVIQTSESFTTYPNIDIVNLSGYRESACMSGQSKSEAISNCLNEFRAIISNNYPNGIPEKAIYYRNAEERSREIDHNNKYETVEYKDDWRTDKLKRHVKSGPYLEFQLETDGTYTFWNENSIFVGNMVFGPVWELFCREPKDFNTWGPNLFTVSELEPLRDKLFTKLKELNSYKSLSDFLENGVKLLNWIHEPGKVVWKEIRDAIVEFLEAVIEMVDQGIDEKRALFVLGV